MDKKTLKKIKSQLEEQKRELIANAESSREEGVAAIEQAELADEVDLATTETGHSLTLRLRDRELVLLKKINKALKKIDNGDYGICEKCGEEIEKKRLEIRPVADYCIRCKEEQERIEKGFAE